MWPTVFSPVIMTQQQICLLWTSEYVFTHKIHKKLSRTLWQTRKLGSLSLPIIRRSRMTTDTCTCQIWSPTQKRSILMRTVSTTQPRCSTQSSESKINSFSSSFLRSQPVLPKWLSSSLTLACPILQSNCSIKLKILNFMISNSISSAWL